mmetsp:Transcript_46111/g.116098  ORF Transcript_46111/g.116098 Transcript_46111/m.116098 type:complete len:773 (-) Transcript_46111:48-2366(-)
MGKKYPKKRRPNHRPQDGPPHSRVRVEREPLPLENELFEAYYRELFFADKPEEYEAFLSTFRTPLPVTFRLTTTTGMHAALQHALRQESVQVIEGEIIDDVEIRAPKTIAWYPGELAWELNVGKRTLKRHAALKNFHQFLVSSTERGAAVRQEAVSMVPPLFMHCEAHHRVLDMCAAPGSKTTQLLEELMSKAGDSALPTGVVVANDANERRAQTLQSVVKRLGSNCCVVINHEAQSLPLFRIPPPPGVARKDVPAEYYLFDRILADVPCTGDGTLRKSPDIWKKWRHSHANSIHKVQLQITLRAVELLKPGGRLVYSTCSLNPVEDEAVVAEVLRRFPGVMELVDVSSEIPLLKRSPGINTWPVYNDSRVQWMSPEDIPLSSRSKLEASIFPPPPEIAPSLHLERCMRFFPHQQDTGGFFVCVLRKRDEVPAAPLHKYRSAVEAEVAYAEQGLAAFALRKPPKVQPAESPSSMEEAGDSDPSDSEESSAASTSSESATISSASHKGKEEAEDAAESDFVDPWNYHKKRPNSENPFIPVVSLLKETAPVEALLNDYGLELNPGNVLVRSDRLKSFILITDQIRELLHADSKCSLKLISCGLRTWSRQYKLEETDGPVALNPNSLRPYSEAARLLATIQLPNRRVDLTTEEFLALVKSPVGAFHFTDPEKENFIKNLGAGGVFGTVSIDRPDFNARLPYVGVIQGGLSLSMTKLRSSAYAELIRMTEKPVGTDAAAQEGSASAAETSSSTSSSAPPSSSTSALPAAAVPPQGN